MLLNELEVNVTQVSISLYSIKVILFKIVGHGY